MDENVFPPDPDSEYNGMLVICHPRKISFYKYINNEAHWDVLEVEGQKAYRL